MAKPKLENKSIPCCRCKTRQTVTFITGAISVGWTCQMEDCQCPNYVRLKVSAGVTVKDGNATAQPILN